ncbi:MAG: phenylalanine--tRNA ligase subunit alpha [Leptospiraceae bacterium]|nr:phenylalanine--tRNA ligase subunit alpha [Leptospiraceae bacterium]
MSLEDQILNLEKEALTELKACQNARDLEDHYHRYLGKKGELTAILRGLKDLTPEEKKTTGQTANRVRQALEAAHKTAGEDVRRQELETRLRKERYDALRPLPDSRGHLHPVTAMQLEVERIFTGMGFQIMDGPEVETDENNFGRLNFSEDHPARDMQDTIWTTDGHLMRTHTSSVQVRALQILEPPFRIIAPGRVFRYEETDASHESTFHQVEGMMVDRNISVANLIYIMKTFLSSVFEREVKVRLRPGYFPFVEPGFELDINCYICDGAGCRTCKHSGWIELLPCGLVHPNVLDAGGIDSTEWSGFAFGLGLDRLVMMKYGIEDIRHLFSGNLRFLRQFP